MTRNQLRMIAVIFGLGVFIAYVQIVAFSGQITSLQLTPTPIVFPPPNQSQYPELICPYFVEPRSGYSWQGITIGETTQSELEAILSGFGKYEIIYRQENSLSNAIRYRWNESTIEAEEQQAPVTVDVCLQDGSVIVMELNWSRQPPHLSDLITDLGLPDVVTWSWIENTRVAFWFEKGIASEVFTQLGNDVSFGLVIRTIYFPAQSSEGYEGRWPFTVTRMQPFYPVDPSIPNERNPFDVNAMIATITAEPSRTPTSTFIPTPVMTTETPSP